MGLGIDGVLCRLTFDMSRVPLARRLDGRVSLLPSKANLGIAEHS